MSPRAATAGDAPAIAALWNDMIRNSLATFTEQEKTVAGIEALLAARADAVWVTDDVDGFVTWGPFRSGTGYARTIEHTIIAAQTGRGIGSALLSHAAAKFTQQGHHVMVAAISSANEKAVGFHARHGFAQIGRMPQVGFKNGQWLDLVLMQKTLINA